MKTTYSRLPRFVDSAVGADLHAKRVLSLSNAVVGMLTTAALAIHAIGLGLAKEKNLDTEHAIKQVDRLVSNMGIKRGTYSFFGCPLWSPRAPIDVADSGKV
jgi:hypothetical protein